MQAIVRIHIKRFNEDYEDHVSIYSQNPRLLSQLLNSFNAKYYAHYKITPELYPIQI